MNAHAGFTQLVIDAAYLVASVLFILGLKRLSSPATARGGNALGATGMLIAVLATLLDREIVGFSGILVGVLIGSAIGVVAARAVKMTAMPQMVALLNGFGGGASVLVATDEYLRVTGGLTTATVDVALTIVLSVLIGAVTFSGSLVAFGKLQEIVTGRAVTYPLQKTLNALLGAGILVLAARLTVGAPDEMLFWMLIAAALVLGVLL